MASIGKHPDRRRQRDTPPSSSAAMWPTTASQLHTAHPAGPSSPPETPRTASPVFNRQNSPKYRGSPSRSRVGTKPMSQPPNIRAPASGPGFNVGRQFRPDQLSPRSTSSSDSSSDSDSSDSESITSEQPEASPLNARPIAVSRITHNSNIIVEEMGDFEDGDEERLEAVLPDHFEYPDSDRSRSRSRNPPEIDQTVMYKFRNLDCSDESDETDFDDDEYQEFLLRRRAEKRRKRMTSGSIGKRTISESIGSDTDREDLKIQFLDAREAGSSARRLRRKVGNRQSLQFQDPPLPRIDQADEPNTSDDEFLDDDDALKEMPYYTLDYITMEIDSP